MICKKMKSLYLILIIIIIFTIILNYMDYSKERTAIQIVNDMGIGYNLGNSFDSYNHLKKINSPDEQITLLGNPIPTKKLIKNIKKYGFKTIRFPVTWINFIDDFGNINSDWMSRVKEVVDWITQSNLYCILNLYYDGDTDNWLSEGIKSRTKFINLWKQISEVFKDSSEYLIFESMDQAYYTTYDYEYDYSTLLNLTQAFVDTIRKSGGNNQKRLLIISGADSDLDKTCSSKYKMPIDPFNMSAVSINYYIPDKFVLTTLNFPWSYSDKWGTDSDYNELITNFEIIKKYYVNKGIPVIIVEVGVLTEEKKDLSSIREYLYSVFSISFENDGIMSCLWDTSNKNYGNMNYYNRLSNEWYDEKIKNIIYDISRGKFIKSSDFYIMTNLETVSTLNDYGGFTIKLGNRNPVKIILNVKITGGRLDGNEFGIVSFDKKTGEMMEIHFGRKNGKKQYDGTYFITIDINNEDCSDYIQIMKFYGEKTVTFNNLTVEFEEDFLSFDYKTYKTNIIKNIN